MRGSPLRLMFPRSKAMKEREFHPFDYLRLHNDYGLFSREEVELQSCFISVKKKISMCG